MWAISAPWGSSLLRWRKTLWKNKPENVFILANLSTKMADLASEWHRHFRLPSASAERYWRNLTELRNYSTSFINFVVFGPIRQQRWLPWPSIGRNIFKPRNRFWQKQVLNILYQVCIFRAYLSKRMNALGFNWLGNCDLLHCSPELRDGFWRNSTDRKFLN